MCVTLVCLFLTVTGLIVLDRYTREHAESSKPGYSVQHGQDWLALNDPIDGMVSDSKQQPRFRGVATTSGTLDALPTAQQQTVFTYAMTDRDITSTLSTTTLIHIDKDGTALHESNACVGGRILIIGKQGVWHCLIPWTPVTRPLIWPNP
jgi:hypothetical protein